MTLATTTLVKPTGEIIITKFSSDFDAYLNIVMTYGDEQIDFLDEDMIRVPNGTLIISRFESKSNSN